MQHRHHQDTDKQRHYASAWFGDRDGGGRRHEFGRIAEIVFPNGEVGGVDNPVSVAIGHNQ